MAYAKQKQQYKVRLNAKKKNILNHIERAVKLIQIYNSNRNRNSQI